MSLESEAAIDKEARYVLADMLEASGNEDLARWWRSELIDEYGDGSGLADGAGPDNGLSFSYGHGSGHGSSNGSGRGSGYGALGYGFGALNNNE